MKTVTVNYDIDHTLKNNSVIAPPLIIKGGTTVNISLTSIDEKTSIINSLTIDWGDGQQQVVTRDLFFNYRKQSIFNEIKYGKTNGTILGVFSHDYVNRYNTYEVEYTISIVALNSIGNFFYIKQPVRCFWGSFYDGLERLTALNTQILPDDKNTTFLNLESKDGTIYATTLKETGAPLLSGAITGIPAIDLYGFEEPGFLATSDGVDIEFTTVDDGDVLVTILLGFEKFDPYIMFL